MLLLCLCFQTELVRRWPRDTLLHRMAASWRESESLHQFSGRENFIILGCRAVPTTTEKLLTRVGFGKTVVSKGRIPDCIRLEYLILECFI